MQKNNLLQNDQNSPQITVGDVLAGITERTGDGVQGVVWHEYPLDRRAGASADAPAALG